MPWISVLVCGAAAYRLWATPLWVAGAAVAGISVATLVVLFVVSSERWVRAATALQHVTLASGGFLLFVSVAMRA
jgi:hypothetical protein